MVFKKNPLIITNSNSPKMETPGKQSAGILDDFAVRKTIATQQGRITNTPVNDLDIANKKYVDSAITSAKLWTRTGTDLSLVNPTDTMNLTSLNKIYTSTGDLKIIPQDYLWLGGRSSPTVRYLMTDAFGQTVCRRDNDSATIPLTIENRNSGAIATNDVCLRFNSGSSGSTTAIAAGQIRMVKDQTWTSTTSTRDNKMVFSCCLNGTLTDVGTLSSVGDWAVDSVTATSGTITSLSVTSLTTTNFRANTITGSNLTLRSDSGGDTPTAQPLYLNTGSTTGLTMSVPDAGVIAFTLNDDSIISAEGLMITGTDANSYFILEWADGYSYWGLGVNGLQIWLNADAGQVLDLNADGTSKFYENATFDKNLDAATYSVGGIAGISATITTAKLTSGGANGSMTFVNGILTAQTAAT